MLNKQNFILSINLQNICDDIVELNFYNDKKRIELSLNKKVEDNYIIDITLLEPQEQTKMTNDTVNNQVQSGIEIYNYSDTPKQYDYIFKQIDKCFYDKTGYTINQYISSLDSDEDLTSVIRDITSSDGTTNDIFIEECSICNYKNNYTNFF